MYLYCLGVYQYRYIHHDFSVSRSCSTTRVSILKIRVAITGFRAPAKLDMITLQEFRAFNQRRIPFFKAWGILALVGDTCIWVASDSYILDVGEELMALTYYLLRVRDSIVHRQQKLIMKLQTLLIGTL